MNRWTESERWNVESRWKHFSAMCSYNRGEPSRRIRGRVRANGNALQMHPQIGFKFVRPAEPRRRKLGISHDQWLVDLMWS